MSIDINTVTTTSFRNLIEEKFLNWAMSKSSSYRILYVIYVKALFHNNFLANIGKAKKGYEIDILCDYLDIDEVVFLSTQYSALPWTTILLTKKYTNIFARAARTMTCTMP